MDRSTRSQDATTCSSCAFSFSRAWARVLSPQNSVDSESLVISAIRWRFRSTSKRPPESVEAAGQVGEQVGGGGGHVEDS
jgi:hypothetical protein